MQNALEKALVDKIFKKCESKGIQLPRITIQKAIEHPLNLKKKDLEVRASMNSNAMIGVSATENKAIFKRKVKRLLKHSNSTKVLFQVVSYIKLLTYNALVVERKDDLPKPKKTISSISNKPNVKPKTNTWWSRREYQAFHDNIDVYRKSKLEEKLRSQSIIFCSTVYEKTAITSRPMTQGGRSTVVNETRTQTPWQERFPSRSNSRMSGGPAAVFVDSKTFISKRSDRNSSRQSDHSLVYIIQKDSNGDANRFYNKPSRKS